MTTKTATADPFPGGEDTVAQGVKAVASLGALMVDAVPMCTPAVRGVERGPAHRRHHAVRMTVKD